MSRLRRLWAGRARRGYRLQPDIPVLRITEHPVTGGGLGMPSALALVEWLTAAGHNPHFVLGALSDTAELLSAFAPVHALPDPVEGLARATVSGAGAVVFEGAFRRGADFPSATRTLAATLTERAARQGSDWPAEVCLRFDTPGTALSGQLNALTTGMDWSDLRVLAFAGSAHGLLGRALRAEGARLLRLVRIDGVGSLPARLCARLEAEAHARGAQLVTAEADTARLPGALRQQVLAMPLRLQIVDWSPLARVLATEAGRHG